MRTVNAIIKALSIVTIAFVTMLALWMIVEGIIALY